MSLHVCLRRRERRMPNSVRIAGRPRYENVNQLKSTQEMLFRGPLFQSCLMSPRAVPAVPVARNKTKQKKVKKSRQGDEKI